MIITELGLVTLDLDRDYRVPNSWARSVIHPHLLDIGPSLPCDVAIPDWDEGHVTLKEGVTPDGVIVEAGVCKCGQGFYRVLGIHPVMAGCN